MKLLRSDQMQEADRRTIEEIGLPGAVLMENAGAGVERILKNRSPGWRKKPVLILAGAGNNGGDGFVIARRLLQSGARVRVFLFTSASKLHGDALLHYKVFTRVGGTVKEITKSDDLTNFSSSVIHAGVVVDAVFGTGLIRPVKGFIAQAFEMLNLLDVPVLAVDLPSGVCADSGKILGCGVKADWTVTFATEKIGHRLYPGAGLSGEITTIPIGIPQDFIEIDSHQVARNLLNDLTFPRRQIDGHKGSFGHLLVIAGSVGKEGAATLTALGALRTGPGLVTVATPEKAQRVIGTKLTEAMTIPLPTTENQDEHTSNWLNTITNSKIRPSAIAMGPGLGTAKNLTTMVQGVARQWGDTPLLLDADAINLLAKNSGEIPFITKDRKAPLILTPHPGEMARLLGVTVEDIQNSRLESARRTAAEWQIWLVLKGADTIIAAPDSRAWINDNGNSGLASGGSGDLLTGIIAGLLTQGWPVETAIRSGVWLHGAAADAVVADGYGEAGVLAQDLLPQIIKLRNTLTSC
ncbi:MAG: NAD(P)H-hydrate dehydratase [Magnetococcales bacterium]|nr:NAD(P)H-hydrate dehydratase [Magnetococcales bacterium]